jgi:hypothetical protein
MEIAWGLLGERNVRRQTSDKEIGRFFGFLKFFCVFSGSFGIIFYTVMHLFSEPAKSHAIRHEVTV